MANIKQIYDHETHVFCSTRPLHPVLQAILFNDLSLNEQTKFNGFETSLQGLHSGHFYLQICTVISAFHNTLSVSSNTPIDILCSVLLIKTARVRMKDNALQ